MVNGVPEPQLTSDMRGSGGSGGQHLVGVELVEGWERTPNEEMGHFLKLALSGEVLDCVASVR